MSDTIYWQPRYGIQIALDDAGENQRDLAKRLGWSEARLSKIINGKQKLVVSDLSDIAEKQGKDVAWYFQPPPNRAMGVWPTWDELALAG